MSRSQLCDLLAYVGVPVKPHIVLLWRLKDDVEVVENWCLRQVNGRFRGKTPQVLVKLARRDRDLARLLKPPPKV